MKAATSVKIYLADGTADGLRIVEKSNWTGRAVICSRAQFSEAKRRPEFNRTGVYLLLGLDESDELPVAYIGEGDPVLPRLEAHERSKDFWDTVIIFSSKDENLNKAHIQYLEARLVEIAAKAKRCVLTNGNSPSRPALSEADGADLETFLTEMQLVYSVLGVKIFDFVTLTTEEVISEPLLQIKAAGVILGDGVHKAEGFVVRMGTRCLKKEVPSYSEKARALRKSLLDRGVLVAQNEYLVFAQDFVFPSPSQAAYIILGRSANGRTEWKTSSGKTLKELQEQD